MKNSKGFGSYLVFMVIILLLMFGLETLKDHGDPYTRAEYVTDLQEGTVREIVITPNKEELQIVRNQLFC